MVDLAATQLNTLKECAFDRCGVTQVSVPASLRELSVRAFAGTLLKVLDLSTCAGICVNHTRINSLLELSLPLEGFAAAARALLPGSRIRVLRADVGEAEISELFRDLEGWGLDELRVVSPRVGERQWQRTRVSVLVEMTDPLTVTKPASVTMTALRRIPVEWRSFLRVIDLSGWAVELLPRGATLRGLSGLETTVLPTGLRVLPEYLFSECWRLTSIDTRYTALEKIESMTCDGCRSLTAFAFPPSFRILKNAFDGTSVTALDLSSTLAEDVSVRGMIFLMDLVLPRRCVLAAVSGMPSIRRVTFGACEKVRSFVWHPTEVRFECVTAHAEFSPDLLEARVYGEVGCEMGCETLPLPPP
jgi:hypothetical protein